MGQVKILFDVRILLCAIWFFSTIGLGFACGPSLNNECVNAQSLSNTLDQDHCINSCTENASTGLIFPMDLECASLPFSTVWYELNTGPNLNILDLTASSTEVDAILISIYSGTCNGLLPQYCGQGSNGSLDLFGNKLLANRIYYMAVSSMDGSTGEIDLCYRLSEDLSACNTDNIIEVINTSLGSPNTGPFKPNETIEFCYTINGYDNMSCNYIHSIVPYFGNGWDPSSFDANGQPQRISQAIQTQGVIDILQSDPVCEGSPTGVWQWYPAGVVDYNLNSSNTMGLSNNDPIGAGWTFYNSFDPDCFNFTNVCCVNPGTDPNDGYGDNDYPACYFNPNHEWKVCFELTTRDAVDCDNFNDCSVSMKSFADGETGAFSNSGCKDDPISRFNAKLLCGSTPTIDIPQNDYSLCVGETLSFNLMSSDPNAVFYWINQSDNSSGFALNNPALYSQVFNETGSFIIEFYASNGCKSPVEIVSVEVIDAITTSFTLDLEFCEDDNDYVIPTTSQDGYTGSWSIPVISPATLGSGNYNVLFTPDNSCVEPINLDVEILDSQIPIFNLPNVLCQSDNIYDLPLVSDNGMTGNWNIASIDPALNSGQTINLEFSPDASCSEKYTTQIQIIEEAIPSFLLPQTFCTNDLDLTMPLTSEDGFSGSWSSSMLSPSNLGVGNFTFSFIPDGSEFCVGGYDYNFEIIETSTASFSFETTMCESDPVLVLSDTDDNGVAGSWNITQVDPAQSADQIIDLEFVADDSCVETYNTSIEVLTVLTPVFSISTSYCQSANSFVLPNLSDNGIIGNWDQLEVDPAALGVGIHIFNFTPDIDQDCVTELSLEIEVSNSLSPIFDLPKELCSTDLPFTLNDISDNGAMGQWSQALVDIGEIGIIDLEFIPKDISCTSVYQHQLLVKESPSLNLLDSPSVCKGSSINLTDLNIVDDSGLNSTISFHTGSPADLSNVIVDTEVLLNTDTDFVALATNDGCTNELVFTIYVEPLLSAGESTTNEYCKEDLAQFNLYDLLGGTYDLGGNWTQEMGSMVNLSDPESVDVSGAAGPLLFTYQHSATAECQETQAQVAIEILEAPDYEFNKTNESCAGLNDGEIVFTSNNGQSLEISIDGINWSSLLLYNELNPGLYNFEIRNENLCISNELIEIEEGSEIQIEGLIVECNNNDSPTDGSDDYYLVSFEISNDTQVGSANVFDNGVLMGAYTYNNLITINILVDGLNHNIVIVDNENQLCQTEIDLGQLVPCAESCDLIVTNLIVGDCMNAQTPNDDADDVFNVSLSLNSVILSGSQYETYLDGQLLGISDYNQLNEIDNIPADANDHLIEFVDLTDFSCVETITVNSDPCSSCDEFAEVNGSDILQIDCANQMVTPSIDLSSTGSYVWYGPNSQNVYSNLLEPIFDQAGDFTLEVIHDNACVSRLSVTVEDTRETIDFNIIGDRIINCYNNGVSLVTDLLNTAGFDFNWYDENGILVSNDPIIMIDQPGVYSLQIVNQNNKCVSQENNISIVEDRIMPDFIVAFDPSNVIDCKTDQVILRPEGDLTGFELSWNNGGQLSNGNELLITQESHIELTITNIDNGCIQLVELDVYENKESPLVILEEPDTLDCANSMISINANGSSEGAEYLYQWYNSLLEELGSESNSTLNVTEEGMYYLEISNLDNGCSTMDSVMVMSDLETPEIEMLNDQIIPCGETSVTLELEMLSAMSDYQIIWSDANGDVISNGTETTQLINEVGWFYVELINNRNSCSSLDSILVLEDPNIIFDFDVNISEPTCFNEASAALEIVNIISNSQGEFIYTVDGELVQTEAYFENLEAGEHSIQLINEAGCTIEQIIFIPEAEVLEMEIMVDDLTIALGDSVQLQVTTAFNESIINTISWTNDEELSCGDCLNPFAFPTESQTYEISITNLDGCIIRASIDIEVLEAINVYVPNAFSPNGDGQNDFFTVYGGEAVTKVEKLSVFNRWGNRVFHAQDIDPSDEESGWDGSYNGENLINGVYVYYAEVQMSNGETITFKGDLTLLR